MAISCFNHGFQNPFVNSKRVSEHSSPETMGGTGEQAETEAAKREAIRAEFENEKLLPDTVTKLNEALAKAPKEELDMWLSNISRAMEEIVLIDALLAKYSENRPMQAALVAVYEARNEILGKLKLTMDDIRVLGDLQEMAEQRVDLLEAHLIQDPSKVSEVKDQALSFVRKADTKDRISTADNAIQGIPYIFDFINPLNGKLNTFAQRNITLADVMKALGVNSLRLKKKGVREPVTAYLWPDKGAHGEAHSVPNDGSATASKTTYLPVLEGDSFTLAKTEVPKVATAPTVAPVQATSSVDLRSMPRPTPGPDGVPRGALGYRMSEEEQLAMVAPNLTVGTVAPEVVSEDFSDLKDKKITIPKELRKTLNKENPWQEIENLKYKDNGGAKVYEAVNYLAERRSKDGLDTDNRTMWESLFGFNNNTVSFNEIVRAAYNINIGDSRFNKPGEWLLKEHEKSTGAKKAEYGEVLKAADTILEHLPKLKDSGITAETYREMREAGLPPEMAAASQYTDEYLFDKDSLAAPVKLNVFQAISFWGRPEDRPVVTQDNWLDQTRAPSKEARRLNQGEIEIVSQGEAYDTLMAAGTPEAYLRELNRYRIMGEGQINAMANLNGLRGINVDETEIHTEPITSLDVEPTAEQKKAIHYGVMLEAAEKLRIYQDAEAQLSAEEREERNYRSTGDVYGTGSLGASMDIPVGDDANVGGTGALAARANVLPGTTVDAGGVFSVWDGGEEVATDLDARAVLSWKSRRFGKNRRWRAGAGVHGEVDIPDGHLGADANAYVMYDLKQDGPTAAKLGVNAGVSQDEGASVGAELGLEVDFDRLYLLRLAEFKEKNAGVIAAAKAEARATIDASDYDPAAKEALKQASDAHIDMLVEQGVMLDWTQLSKQIKLAGGGVQVGAKLTLRNFLKNGVRVGPFITFAFGFKPTTYYVEASSTGGRADGSVDTSAWIADDADMIQVDLPVAELYIGGEAERAEAIERAQVKIDAAREARNEGLKETMSFSRVAGVPYDKVDFKNLPGHVQLFVDPRSDIEMITDGSNNFLNTALENNLHIFIDTTDSSQPGQDQYTIYISDQADATPESIAAASTSHLEWFQQLNGNINNSRIVGEADSENFYTLAAANAAGLESKDKDAEDYVDQLTHEDLVRQTHARNATLFDEYEPNDFTLAETVGAELIANGIDYDTLALGNDDARIMAEIKKLYLAHGLDESEINIDRIYMARQHAMEVGRPKNLEVPIEWNSEAVMNIDSAGGKLYADFMARNKEAIEAGGLRNNLPAGSEFYISVSHKGVARGEALLLGYYDARLHGDILAQVEWDDKNPAATLAAMGIEDTPANRQAVIDMKKAIEEQAWPTSPFNTLSDASFEKAKYTIAGELLITNAIELYGAEKGQRLREMAAGNLTDAELEAEFLVDVQELLSDAHHTMVGETPVTMDMEIRSGLYEKCFNLVVSRNFRLNYQPPQKKHPEIKVDRRSRQEGLRVRQGFEHKQVEITTGLPSFETKTSKVDADQTGDGYEGEAAEAGDTEDGDGSTTEHP